MDSIRDPETGEINYDETALSDMWSVPPQYTILPVATQTSVDPGEQAQIDIYLSGYGEPRNNKFQIHFPYPEFVDEDDPGEIKTSLDVDDDGLRGERNLRAPTEDDGRALSGWGGTTVIPPEFFRPLKDKKGAYPLLASEVAFDEQPFLSVNIQTDENASPGNYPIQLTYLYGNGDAFSQTRETVYLHLNNKWESLAPFVTYAAIIAAILAFLSLMVQAIDTLLDYFFV